MFQMLTSGDAVLTISASFIIYLIVAAIVGVVAEYIVGWRLPFGIIGAIIAALIGIWLMTHLLIINGIGDIYVAGVPLLRALVGAIILVAIWHLLTYRTWRHRRRYYYRRY
jgi:uncharacterized membrane protein YeaQ/YmgE (transglycosylase-associated protein family)